MTDDDKEFIEAACQQVGLTPDAWAEDEIGQVVAQFSNNRWRVADEAADDERGLYPGDEGELVAYAVGSERYSNKRVMFVFVPDGYDDFSGPEVQPFEDVDVVR